MPQEKRLESVTTAFDQATQGAPFPISLTSLYVTEYEAARRLKTTTNRWLKVLIPLDLLQYLSLAVALGNESPVQTVAFITAATVTAVCTLITRNLLDKRLDAGYLLSTDRERIGDLLNVAVNEGLIEKTSVSALLQLLLGQKQRKEVQNSPTDHRIDTDVPGDELITLAAYRARQRLKK